MNNNKNRIKRNFKNLSDDVNVKYIKEMNKKKIQAKRKRRFKKIIKIIIIIALIAFSFISVLYVIGNKNTLKMKFYEEINLKHLDKTEVLQDSDKENENFFYIGNKENNQSINNNQSTEIDKSKKEENNNLGEDEDLEKLRENEKSEQKDSNESNENEDDPQKEALKNEIRGVIINNLSKNNTKHDALQNLKLKYGGLMTEEELKELIEENKDEFIF